MRTITDEELKKIKEISLEMLKDFDAFCGENGLDYFVSCGSALGAVRHGGFIPWDDDVDVDMPVESYHKLVRVWKTKGMKEKYFLQTKKTDPDLPYPFYRIRRNGTTWSDDNCEKLKIHWGLPIDIFPVWHAPKNKFLQKLQYRCHGYGDYYSTFAFRNPEASVFKKHIFYLLTLVLYRFVDFFSFISKNSGLSYSPNDTSVIKDNPVHISQDIRLPAKDILFEGITLKGPNKPDEYLTWKYGDYMTPPDESQRGGTVSVCLTLKTIHQYIQAC